MAGERNKEIHNFADKITSVVKYYVNMAYQEEN